MPISYSHAPRSASKSDFPAMNALSRSANAAFATNATLSKGAYTSECAHLRAAPRRGLGPCQAGSHAVSSPCHAIARADVARRYGFRCARALNGFTEPGPASGVAAVRAVRRDAVIRRDT